MVKEFVVRLENWSFCVFTKGNMNVAIPEVKKLRPVYAKITSHYSQTIYHIPTSSGLTFLCLCKPAKLPNTSPLCLSILWTKFHGTRSQSVHRNSPFSACRVLVRRATPLCYSFCASSGPAGSTAGSQKSRSSRGHSHVARSDDLLPRNLPRNSLGTHS